jgi:hypothetical protein
MRPVSPIQGLAVFLCLILLQFVAFTPTVVRHTLAILVCLCYLIPVAVFVCLASIDEEIHLQQASAIAAFSPRPPPAL